MNQEERRQAILDQLKQEGKVRVASLSRRFSISEVTIRNDLAELERASFLERVHGGAVQTSRNYYALSYSERQIERKEEKIAIAKEVVSLIKEGDSLVLNSGSTSYYVACELAAFKQIRVITNSMEIAKLLSEQSDIDLVVLGGRLSYRYIYTYGDDAIRQMKRYQVDKCILSVDGVDSELGISTYHQEVVALLEQMLWQSSSSIVVADKTKLGRTAFAHICKLDKLDYLVTCQKPDSEVLKDFTEDGLKVIYPQRKNK